MIHRSLLLALVVALAPFARGAQEGIVEGVRVYTTAKDTALRMGLSDRLQGTIWAHLTPHLGPGAKKQTHF